MNNNDNTGRRWRLRKRKPLPAQKLRAMDPWVLYARDPANFVYQLEHADGTVLRQWSHDIQRHYGILRFGPSGVADSEHELRIWIRANVTGGGNNA